MKRDWVFDDKGNKCEQFSKMIDSESRWIEDYEMLILSIATRKDENWKHEEEMRLILSDYWKDEIPNGGVPIEYDFSKLVGIIFGVNMDEEMKVKIVNAIKSIKKSEDSFDYYQAYYNYIKGEIAIRKIPIND